MRFTMRHIFIWMTILLLIGLSTQGASAQVREKVRIGLPQDIASALMTVAIEKGFLSREGLDVEVKEYPSGKRSLEGMFAGEVDISIPADIPVVINSFDRQDFSIFATIASTDRYHAVIARKDKGINLPSDLRGKRIATQKASAVHYYLYLFLLKYGMSPKGVILSFKKPEELPALLASGEIDAFSMREPFISNARRLAGDANAVLFREQGLYTRTDNLAAFKGFIKDRPDVIKRILKALLLAEGFVRNNPEQTIKIVSKRVVSHEPEVASQWNDFEFALSLRQPILTALEDEARWAIKEGLTDKKTVPNYLDFIYIKGLEAVKPDAVTIIR